MARRKLPTPDQSRKPLSNVGESSQRMPGSSLADWILSQQSVLPEEEQSATAKRTNAKQGDDSRRRGYAGEVQSDPKAGDSQRNAFDVAGPRRPVAGRESRGETIPASKAEASVSQSSGSTRLPSLAPSFSLPPKASGAPAIAGQQTGSVPGRSDVDALKELRLSLEAEAGIPAPQQPGRSPAAVVESLRRPALAASLSGVPSAASKQADSQTPAPSPLPSWLDASDVQGDIPREVSEGDKSGPLAESSRRPAAGQEPSAQTTPQVAVKRIDAESSADDRREVAKDAKSLQTANRTEPSPTLTPPLSVDAQEPLPDLFPEAMSDADTPEAATEQGSVDTTAGPLVEPSRRPVAGQTSDDDSVRYSQGTGSIADSPKQPVVADQSEQPSIDRGSMQRDEAGDYPVAKPAPPSAQPALPFAKPSLPFARPAAAQTAKSSAVVTQPPRRPVAADTSTAAYPLATSVQASAPLAGRRRTPSAADNLMGRQVVAGESASSDIARDRVESFPLAPSGSTATGEIPRRSTPRPLAGGRRRSAFALVGDKAPQEDASTADAAAVPESSTPDTTPPDEHDVDENGLPNIDPKDFGSAADGIEAMRRAKQVVAEEEEREKKEQQSQRYGFESKRAKRDRLQSGGSEQVEPPRKSAYALESRQAQQERYETSGKEGKPKDDSASGVEPPRRPTYMLESEQRQDQRHEDIDAGKPFDENADRVARINAEYQQDAGKEGYTEKGKNAPRKPVHKEGVGEQKKTRSWQEFGNELIDKTNSITNAIDPFGPGDGNYRDTASPENQRRVSVLGATLPTDDDIDPELRKRMRGKRGSSFAETEAPRRGSGLFDSEDSGGSAQARNAAGDNQDAGLGREILEQLKEAVKAINALGSKIDKLAVQRNDGLPSRNQRKSFSSGPRN